MNAPAAPTASVAWGAPYSSALQSNAAQTLANLATWSGAAFDRTYIDHQIALHQWLLQSIDTALLPAARNDKLKAQIEAMRPTVQAHLDAAQKIRTSLGS